MAIIKSIEEKAKRYDESIERAKRVLLDCTSEERKVVEYITPELKESEELTEFEKAVKQVMEEAIECGDTHNLKADAEMLLSLVHKSAWSEEDEEMLNSFLHKLEVCDLLSIKECIWIKNKFKALKQNTWKPSDAQMKALSDINVTGGISYAGQGQELINLYNALKKLRGE